MSILYKKVIIITLLLFTVGCASNSKMVSQSHLPGKTKIVYTIEIDAPKEKAWDVLSDFGNLSWTKTVKDAHLLNSKTGIGMIRHCDLNNDGFIVERITQWAEGKEFSYTIVDSSDPVVPGSYATWRIEGDKNKSSVTFEVHYELKYGVIGDMMNAAFAKKKFSKQIVTFMGELKTHLEKTS